MSRIFACGLAWALALCVGVCGLAADSTGLPGLGPGPAVSAGGGGPTDPTGASTSATAGSVLVSSGSVWQAMTINGLVTMSATGAAAAAAQTGTGSTIVMQASPTLNTPTFTLPKICDSTDNTKALAFQLSGAATNTTVTFVFSTPSNRTITFPNSGSDTVGLLAMAQSWTATNTMSGRLRADQGAGCELGSTGAGFNTDTGFGAIFRMGSGGPQNPGTVIIQSDTGNAASNIALYVSTTPTLAFTATATGCLIATGLADSSNVVSTFAAGGSATIAAATYTQVDASSGTLGTFFLWLPAAPNNGQIVRFVKPQGVISTLTISGNGHTLLGAATPTVTGPATLEFTYNTANTTWYRGQ